MGTPATLVSEGFYITIVSPRGSTTKRIDGDLLVVGRSGDCTLTIEHESISRRHLSITYKRGECWVEDHGSLNGTIINNTRLAPHAKVRLKPDDELVLANSGVKLFASVEPFVRKESAPPLPKDEVTVNTKAVVTTTTAEERLLAREAAVPEVRTVRDSQSKAETLVIEAYKKSSTLVHEAEIEAERRVEDIYRRAHDTQAKIDSAYQRRLNEAYRAAEDVFQASQGQAEEILASARQRADQMREQAEAFVNALRLQTERDCEQLLDDAQVTARELKVARLAEADELAKKKEEQMVRAATDRINERMAKFEDDLMKQSEIRRAEIDKEMKSTLQQLEQLKVETQDLEKQKAHSLALRSEIEKSQVSVAGFNAQLTKMTTEVMQMEKARDITRDQLKVLQDSLHMAESKVMSVQHDNHAQMVELRSQFESDKAKWLRDEHERLEAAKVEATRKARKLERELFEELEAKKEQIGREVALLVETQLQNAKGKNPDIKQLQNSIALSVNEQLTVMGKDPKSLTRHKSLIAMRRREKIWTYLVGAAFGAVGLIASQHFTQINLDVSPIQNKIVSALEQRKLDLEKRRFNPPQSKEYRMTYVDNVIYGEKFVDIYLSEDFQNALLSEVVPYLFRTWRVQEDGAIQLLAMINALVKSLEEKRENIHPDFVNSSIEKMRAHEKDTLKKIVELLGSQVRFEAYKKFEWQFYAKYLQSKSDQE